MWLAMWGLQASAWTLGDAYHVEPHTLTDSLYDWDLASGTLYDVLDDTGEPSGFVFVGTSAFTLHPGEGRPAQVLANRLVSYLDVPTDEARTIGETAALELSVSGAVVLGADAWDAVAPAALRLDKRVDKVTTAQDPNGRHVVIVETRRRMKRDRRMAEQWLQERTRWMDEVGIEPGGLLHADRWEQAAGTGAPSRWVSSLKTDVDWGLYAGDVVLPRVAQPWLEVIRDPSGVIDPGAPSSAWASGPEGPRLRVARGRWTEGRAPRRVDSAGIGATSYFSPRASGLYLDTSTTADVAVTAVGGATTHVVVDLPRVEPTSWYSMNSIGEQFQIVAVQGPDESPLLHHPVSIGPQDESRGYMRTIAVRLPEVLPRGATTTIRIQTMDCHRFAHVHDYHWQEDNPLLYSFGSTTGLVRVLPSVRGHAAGAVPVQIRAGVSPGAGKQTHVVLSHGGGDTTLTDTGRWVTGAADTHGMRVAVGKWFEDEVPTTPGTPEIGLHWLHGTSEFDRVGAAVPAVLNMYQGVLPPFPHERLEIVESYRDLSSPYIRAANSVIAPGEAQSYSARLTLFGGARLAASLHWQWWMVHDVPPDDWALPAASSMIYMMEGMRATDAADQADDLWAALGNMVPRKTGWSALSTALALGPILADDAGGGSVALFAAVDQVLDGQVAPSWEGLADGLQNATGRNWDGFLLTWVHSGTTPKVRVTYEEQGDRLIGHVASDLPFGEFRLPILVGTGEDRLKARVQVVDGSADFELPLDGRTARLVADPDGILPLRGLQVERVSR